MKTYELIPTNTQKSYYGKALVKVSDDGTETLYSYGTKIVSRDTEGNLKRYWNGWTCTTGKHIHNKKLNDYNETRAAYYENFRAFIKELNEMRGNNND